MCNNITKIGLLILSIICGLTGESQAQGNHKITSVGPSHILNVKAEFLHNYGLGQFIHWGLSNSIGEESGAGQSDRLRNAKNVMESFNPTEFKAITWANQAKRIGARYVILAAEHQGGFALWPTKFSTYNITKTPYKKDIVKEIVDAYSDQGIEVFLYFAITAHNTSNDLIEKTVTEGEKDKQNRLLAHIQGQIFELLVNYPNVKGLVLDNGTTSLQTKNAEYSAPLIAGIRKKYPSIRIGILSDSKTYNKGDLKSKNEFVEDSGRYRIQTLVKQVDWQDSKAWGMVMDLPEDSIYTTTWSDNCSRLTDDIIAVMTETLSREGDFVLNFRPDSLGNMQPYEDRVAREFGDWMGVNNEAVYNVEKALGVQESSVGYYTQRENALYLTVFNRPLDNILGIRINKNVKGVAKKAYLLDKGTPLVLKKAKMSLANEGNDGYEIHLPTYLKTDRPFVVKIDLGPANEK